MTNPLLRLAEVAADWRHRPVEEPVRWATRRAILDWFATTLPGCVRAPATIMAPAMMETEGSGRAWCYVDEKSCSPRRAAFLNAVASHTVEFDDIFKDGGYHPGSPTISAALAFAQHLDSTLDDLHRAIIAGYEVGCRISLAIQPSHYAFWHTTSTVGTIGAAVAGSILMGGDSRVIGHAIALATSFAGGHQQNLQGEGMAKALHPGHAADAGLMAALAAAAGVTGSLESLHADKGFAAATSETSGDWAHALDGLGTWTPITRMTVKAHGCCGHIFPALDGIGSMRKQHGFNPADIERIEVSGYRATQSMCDRPEPVSAQDARFSLQYCLAVYLFLGGVRLSAFEPAIMGRADIRDFMQRIRISEDPVLSANYPVKRQARLTVTLRGGHTLRHLQETRRGDPEDPLSDADLIAKFHELSSGTISRGDRESLVTTVLLGEELPARLKRRASEDCRAQN
ncbi:MULTISPECIES: MmgE/PrpD family protein [Agrobacterium]|uniref:MmgE/PrpD family protein n=2 Tax=Agrobacterium TaxID=357 RepID=A0AAF0H308_AGRTU|nr:MULTISPECIES: MmgE/PrpD family protein [Agrobacterium]WGM61098.1 MmgE/PrpD family protein [Agrobacterium tumefaciens]CVI62969.1 MmgE/PrpD family protein [Agrobacterium salinitolerans str. Hayward 0363]